MNRTAALVSCSKTKLNNRSVSWKLYDSRLFKKSWTAAMHIGTPFVVSAEHGLVSAGLRLDPYDTDLRDFSDEERKQWAADVVADIPGFYDTVVLLASETYAKPLLDVAAEERGETEVLWPYGVASGNGQQMAIADNITDCAPAHSVPEILDIATREYR